MDGKIEGEKTKINEDRDNGLAAQGWKLHKQCSVCLGVREEEELKEERGGKEKEERKDGEKRLKRDRLYVKDCG